MNGMVALVSCGGKYVPASHEQLAVIAFGENNVPQMLFEEFRTPKMGDYEYVIGTGFTDRYLKNVYTGKCRAVLVVQAPKVWDEPINHPPRGF